MMDIILVVIAVLVFGIPVFMNTVGPFIVWKTQRLPANVKFQPIDDNEFMEGRNSEFVYYDKSIKELGFDIVGSSLLQDSHTDSHFRLYWNKELKVAAMAVTAKSKIEEVTYIEFTQLYGDGSVLDVSNSPRPEAYPRLEFKHAYRYPDKKAPCDLLEAHKKLKEGIKITAAIVDYDLSRGFGEVEDWLKKESDALLEKGIVKPEIDEEGKRRLTLLGAIALTYRAVPPGKNIWAFVTEQRAKKALKSV